MVSQISMYDIAAEPSAYSHDDVVTMLIDDGVSMALDNGSDMLGVNPYDHARTEWPAYIGHAAEQFRDVMETDGVEYDFDLDACLSEAVERAPSMWDEQHNIELDAGAVEQHDLSGFLPE